MRRRASPLEARRRVSTARMRPRDYYSLLPPPPPLLAAPRMCLRRVERNAHASVQRQLRTWGVTALDSRISRSRNDDWIRPTLDPFDGNSIIEIRSYIDIVLRVIDCHLVRRQLFSTFSIVAILMANSNINVGKIISTIFVIGKAR